MQSLTFTPRAGRPLTILALGAHCDDIEIGCGGTILRLLRDHPDAVVHWVVVTSDPVRRQEAEASAAAFLAGSSGAHEVDIQAFRESFLPFHGADVKAFFEQIKGRVDPDVVLTHYRQDLHQDHRLVCDLTWNTFRDHLILEYEIPKWDGDLGAPNAYVALPADLAAQKVRLILEHFVTQHGRAWFDEETFVALARLRAVECNAPDRRAEAFYARKLLLG